jgi:hypothetical protein
VIRYALLVTGVCAATVAGCSAIWGIWSAAAGWGAVAVLHLATAAVFDLRHRRRERERVLIRRHLRYREAVWDRRIGEAGPDVRAEYPVGELFCLPGVMSSSSPSPISGKDKRREP